MMHRVFFLIKTFDSVRGFVVVWICCLIPFVVDALIEWIFRHYCSDKKKF